MRSTVTSDTVALEVLGVSSGLYHDTCRARRGSGCGRQHRVGVAVTTRLSMHYVTRDQLITNPTRSSLQRVEEEGHALGVDCLSGRVS
jgi:hypothetical protein